MYLAGNRYRAKEVSARGLVVHGYECVNDRNGFVGASRHEQS